MRRTIAAVLALSLAAAVPAGPALAWGHTGHRWVGELAIESLPADVPTFLRSRTAAADVGELSREPDRIRGAGKQADADWAPGHFLDLDDDGKALGGPPASALPANRAGYEAALQAAHTDSWKAGYLPYNIVQTWQRLQLDFAYWRIATQGAKTEKNRARRAWLKADARRREQLILTNIGFLSHWVGDGSQPLHISVHYNGWGDYPNPDGFTTDKIHSPFESAFVDRALTEADVRAKVGAFHDCGCAIEKRVADYLLTTEGYVRPLYQLWKDGAFQGSDPRGKAFASDRLAAGVTELRDLIQLAWTGSLNVKVGYPANVTAGDFIASKSDAYKLLHGGAD